VFIPKDFERCVLEVFILGELQAHFTEVFILGDLAGEEKKMENGRLKMAETTHVEGRGESAWRQNEW